MKTWIITGGAGFIGSNFILKARSKNLARVINFDKLTYAGNLENLESLKGDEDHILVKGDIAEAEHVSSLYDRYQPDAVLHFAAESHVDRSITGPEDFVRTNVMGTFHMLECARKYWSELSSERQNDFRFLHVSTDEVYGSLSLEDPAFSEKTSYKPNSPYSASKAASDHIVRSYFHTYQMPVLTTNCSNNYGCYQFPEKLIPLMINKALTEQPLPIYGDGKNIRDWLHVEDHVYGILKVLAKGRIGETYNIGGNTEKTNREVVDTICATLDRIKPRSNGSKYSDLITFVKDRPGHDRRYAVDASKMQKELGWEPIETFDTGMTKTIDWYMNNQAWFDRVLDGSYRGERLGIS